MKKTERMEIRISKELKEQLKVKGNVSAYITDLILKDLEGDKECHHKN